VPPISTKHYEQGDVAAAAAALQQLLQQIKCHQSQPNTLRVFGVPERACSFILHFLFYFLIKKNTKKRILP
jgi:hypothetical protein